MKDFKSVYMDIITQMKSPGQMVGRMIPKVTPGGIEFRNRGCVWQ